MCAERVYLDHNATSLLRPGVRDAVLSALDLGGNASSVHAQGRAARRMIEQARADVARLVGADPALTVFTSGGTEGAMTLLSPRTRKNGKASTQLIVSAIEHECVRRGGQFAPDQVHVCPVDAQGLLDLTALEHLLRAYPCAMVAVMLANNETGVVQPIKIIADLVHAHDGLLIVDGVQALGKYPLDMQALCADAMFISGHKIGAPQGVGAIIRASSSLTFEPLLTGGGQEGRLRAGTENLAGIVGFGAAARHVLAHFSQEIEHVQHLCARLEAEVTRLVPHVFIASQCAPRLVNTLCLGLAGVRAETLVIACDLAKVAISAGSACSSGKVGRSAVLEAMGVAPDLAASCVRISLGWSTTQADIERFLSVWQCFVPQVVSEPVSLYQVQA